MTDLVVYVVYRHPTDWPDRVVVRRTYPMGRPADDRPVQPDPQEPGLFLDAYVCLCDSLWQARGMLPPGLTRLPRDPHDEPQIVEVWL